MAEQSVDHNQRVGNRRHMDSWLEPFAYGVPSLTSIIHRLASVQKVHEVNGDMATSFACHTHCGQNLHALILQRLGGALEALADKLSEYALMLHQRLHPLRTVDHLTNTSLGVHSFEHVK